MYLRYYLFRFVQLQNTINSLTIIIIINNYYPIDQNTHEMHKEGTITKYNNNIIKMSELPAYVQSIVRI